MVESHLHRIHIELIATELPLEITGYHILSRLPVKSLPRFMCVCKQWQSYLSSRTFAKFHLQRVTKNHHQHHPKLIILSSTPPCNFSIIDCEAPDDHSLTTTRSLPFEANREKISLITSQNGLVCVGIKSCIFNYEYSDLILWNPLKGDYKMLSKTNSQKECFRISGKALSLSYNSCEDDFKLLRVTNSNNVYIYSLKSDSWMKLDCCLDGVIIPSHAVLNENIIYFLGKKGYSIPHSHSYSVIRFDLRTNNLIEISTPSMIRKNQTKLLVVRLKVGIGGWLMLYASYDVGDMYMIESWRMDVDGCWKEPWVVTHIPKYKQPWCLNPLHFMRNGNRLMHSGVENNVCIVDMKKQTKHFFCSYTIRLMDIATGGKFIETFESPNQYMK